MKVGIIGAGPIGLYAAFRLVKAGKDVVIFEKDNVIAGNIRSWGFVRLFSQLELNLPPDAVEVLKQQGKSLPDMKEFLTGAQFVESILEPMAEYLKSTGKCEFMFGQEVLSVGRARFLKTEAIAAAGDSGRVGKPFRLLLRDASGKESFYPSVAPLIDASGSYSRKTGNFLGVAGLPAAGERQAEASGKLLRVIPDVKGSDKASVSGRRVAVVGTGYSASTCLRNLNDLAKAGDGAPTEVYWLTRREPGVPPYSVMENDALPQRSELSNFANDLVLKEGGGDWASAKFEYIPQAGIGEIVTKEDGSLTLKLELGEMGEKPRDLEVDVIFSLVGFHPDKELWSELQVHTCYASDGPMKLAQTLLAAQIAAKGDPAAAGDCLSQAAPGPQTLLNPEPDFYVLGMKSYGRHSTFLMRVGYEQVELLLEQLNQSSQ